MGRLRMVDCVKVQLLLGSLSLEGKQKKVGYRRTLLHGEDERLDPDV